jgi:PAS domain S-box-containing protein
MENPNSSNENVSRDVVAGTRRVVLGSLALAGILELGAKFGLQFRVFTAPAADLVSVAAVLALGFSLFFALHRAFRSRTITGTVAAGLVLMVASQLVEIAGDLNFLGAGDLHFRGGAVFKMVMNTSFVAGLGAVLTGLYLSIFQSLRTSLLLEQERASALHEVAEREGTEKELEASQKRLRTIFEGLEDALFVHDLDGRILDCNRAACDTMGYTRDELLAMRTVDFDTPEFAEGFRERIAHQLREGSYHCVGELITKGGRRITVDIHTTRIDFQGRPAILALNRDISDRVKAEKEHRLMEEKLQHTQKLESLGVLAGGIAHDFNNLLAGVLTNASLALIQMEENSGMRECIEQVEIAAQRASDLARQMLAYSGKGKVVAELVDLGELVDEMAHLLASSISKNAVLKLRVVDDLPAISADPTQIRQVVMNLITNASEALGADQGTVELVTGTVEVSTNDRLESYFDDRVPTGSYVYVEVSDTGKGMDRETLDRIFDPFFTTKFTGRGLGLASVIGIVQGHGGTIQVRSEPGRGSTFRVLFPAAGKCVAPRADRPVLRISPAQSGMILIVDDEEAVLSAARRTLELVGYEVIVAQDGVAGIEAFRAHSSDIALVLLDWTMPRMEGKAVLREIRGIQPGVPVVLSSGFSEMNTLAECVGLMPSGFIQKPYLATDLINLVQITLAGDAVDSGS